MNFSYYPGCTLKNKAQELDRYARRVGWRRWAVTLRGAATSGSAAAAPIPWRQDEIASKLVVRAGAGPRRRDQRRAIW